MISLERALALVVALGSLSCSQPSANAQGGGPSASEGGCAPAALGLARATAVTAWRAPAGCVLQNAGPELTPLRDEAAFARAWRCPAGVGSGVDWRRSSLWVMQTALSPAGAGFAMFLDGARATLVARQRSPCPDDPRPMPMPFSVAFLLPAQPDVTLARAVCTLAPRCR